MKYEGEVRELELIPALVELGNDGFTGALRFENDSIIKIVYFKEGSVLSASTNDRSDSIDEILLKAGKVSREHVKQALTKRKDEESLGDALLGLGFITRKELSWARRVQLLGILRSIMGWDAGSYTLVADYLPKREEGPSFQFEQIVLELILTEGNRAKYDALLDSGAAIFQPTTFFDERFPNLGLNQEAAAVVHLINGSRTASEVVGESTSDAFNVYKLMHALHVLGLLERSSASFDLGVGLQPPEVPIEPTIEMPMDFGADIASQQAPAEPEDFDFGTPAGPAVDLSWQEPAEPDAPGSSTDEFLPPIVEKPATPSSGYDYEPSVPESAMPPIVLQDESPVEKIVPTGAPAPAYKPAAHKQPYGGKVGGSGVAGGRKIAFLVVGLVIVAAVSFAGYVYFVAPQSETALVTREVAPQTAPSAGASVSEGPTETTASEAEAPVEAPATETAEEAAPEPVAEPAKAPPTTTAPAAARPPSVPSGRLAETARSNAAAAGSVAYTVQFALLCQDYSVENAIKVGGSNFWFVPINYQGRNCYRAFWGRYPTRDEAERGMDSIPASLRGGKAVVVEPAKLAN